MLSFLLHVLILLLFTISFEKIVYHEPPAAEKKINLNIKQFKSQPPIPITQPITKPVVKKQIIKKFTKKIPQATQRSKIKKKLLDTKNRLIAQKSNEENNVSKVIKTKITKKSKAKKIVKKRPKKVVKKIKKKIVKRQKIKKQKLVKKKRRNKKHSKDPLANAIMSASTPRVSSRRSSSSNMRMIKKFYGSEFNGFSNNQKKFIRKNLGSIYRITQRTLTRNGYPEVAIRTHQQGTQLVTFYLHPNGNITKLRLKKRIGYASLDKNTIRVIRIAYKDYPRPKTKTKISFYVEYSLY